MTRKRLLRALLSLPLLAAISLWGCTPGEPEITPTPSPVEPTETPPPTSAETPSPGQVGVTISPATGPPGTAVVVLVTGLPAGADVDLGVGLQDEEYEVVSSARVPSEGLLTANVTIPQSAEPGEHWVVVAMTEDAEVEAVSNPFRVTAPPTPAVETPTPSEALKLPDLEVHPPETVFIQLEAGQRVLRFETSFVNLGEADLHLVGERDPELELVRAIQTVLTAAGEERSEEIGQFVFHPPHEHWHLEGFARYELWTDPDRDEQELVAAADKVSFCMFDESPYDLSLPNAPQQRQYPTCDAEVQGLSVGWVDTYRAALEGQALDITGLPDGRYELRKAVNPSGHILESNYDNNETAVVLQITVNTVRILED